MLHKFFNRYWLFILFFLVLILLLITRGAVLLSSTYHNLGNYEIYSLADIPVSDARYNPIYEQSVSLLSAASKLTPQNDRVLFSLARLSILNGDLSQAGNALIQINEPDHQIIKWLSGYVFYKLGDSSRAIEYWTQAGSARQIVSLGVQAADGNYPLRAIELFEIAMQVDPGYANAYYAMGATYLGLGNFELAERYLSKAIELSPNLWWYHLHLAQLYDNQNNYPQALSEYKIALALNSKLEKVRERINELESGYSP
ncbi:MAG: tetratricopeptide repeat protein [Chloroflexota bacterium]|nr:tetratricopeptide repeat protein [Chloroflexota bacterium]